MNGYIIHTFNLNILKYLLKRKLGATYGNTASQIISQLDNHFVFLLPKNEIKNS